MDFSLNDIQKMMQDSASKFIQNSYSFETRQKFAESDLGYSQENWALFAELGWLALPFQEEFGGLDGDLVDLMVLQTELGKGLVVEPFLSTVVLAGNLIQRHGTADQKNELLPAVIAGELKLAAALTEASSQQDITRISTTASATDDGYVLVGKKEVVLGAPSADKILVAARTSGNAGDAAGISLFLVDAAQSGVALQSYPTNDGGRAADVTFDNVRLPANALIGEADMASTAIQSTLNDAVVAICAEAVGIMEKMLSATVEYSKTRKQFDVAIGNFQVLQHYMADMFMETEQARSMLYYGAITVAKADEESDRAASLLKVKIGSAGRKVGQLAVQIHGGMGVTDELDVGHFFKRLTMINTLLGSHDEHLDRLIKQPLAV